MADMHAIVAWVEKHPTESIVIGAGGTIALLWLLGFFGSFYSYEGLHLLLQALPLIQRRRPDVALLLVGGGPEEEHLRVPGQRSIVQTRLLDVSAPRPESHPEHALLDEGIIARFIYNPGKWQKQLSPCSQSRSFSRAATNRNLRLPEQPPRLPLP